MSADSPSTLKELLLAGKVPESNEEFAYKVAAQALAQRGHEDLLNWLVEANSPHSYGAYVNSYRDWLRAELLPATQWVEGLDSGPKKDDVLGITVEHFLPRREFEEAATWLEKISSGTLYEEKALRLGNTWAAQDLQSAQQWASTITDDPTRQSVVELLNGRNFEH